MYGINAKLPKKYFRCNMCSGSHKLQYVYILGNFALPPEHPYEEMEICKACAIREHGKKNKIKLETLTEERTKKWLKNH
jgi:hypothetical protein